MEYKFYRNGVFEVAPWGNDDNDGITAPFASPARAIAEVRKLREAKVPQPIVIKVHAGEYFLSEPLKLDEDTSHIELCAYGDGEVIFNGGMRIEGFEYGTVNGVNCFVKDMPEVREGKLFFSDLFVNDRRADKTRYPEKENLWMEKVEYMEDNNLHAGKTGSRWFIAKEGDIGNFRNMNDIMVSLTHLWVDEHSLIKNYDPITRRVDLHFRTRYRIDKEHHSPRCADYWLENVFEVLNKPGQWYLDRGEGKLYYIPREGETIDNCVFYAPLIYKFVIIKGNIRRGTPAESIRIRNITFTYTAGDYLPEIYARLGSKEPTDQDPKYEPLAAWGQGANGIVGTIDVREAKSVSIEDCILKHIGWFGISFWEGCRGCAVLGCDIRDAGAGGVNITGVDANGDPAYITEAIKVEDNKIRHCGVRYMTASGVLVQHGRNIDIVHNDIYDLYYTGIGAGWVWGYAPSVTENIRIEYNHIYNLGKGLLSDMGGVYLLGKQPGTVVRGNLIHDVKRKYYGGWALYTDEGSSGIVMEDNVCYDTSSNSYHQHYGCGNIIRNNIFAFSDDPLLCVTRPEEHLSIVFTGNILYSGGSAVYAVQDSHITDGRFGSDNNVIWDASGKEPVMLDRSEAEGDGLKGKLTLEDFKGYGFECGSVIADPLFKDPGNRDFTLLPDSPALAMGFKPIDMSNVGARAR